MNLHRLNPVLDLELRQRSRTVRSPIVLTVFLVLLTGMLLLVYEATTASVDPTINPASTISGRSGRAMFEWVVAAELAILIFVVPDIRAGSVSGERARQTLVPLQVTLLRPGQIFLGKVAASSAFVLLLVVSSTPVLAVPFLVGGITIGQVLASMATLLVTGVLVGAIGVGCSVVFRRTQTATLAAYAVVLAMTAGSGIALLTLAVIDATPGIDDVEPVMLVLYPNPVVALGEAAGDVNAPTVGPFTPLKQAFDQYGPLGQRNDSDVMVLAEAEVDVMVAPDGQVIEEGLVNDGRAAEPGGSSLIPVWITSVLAQLAVAGSATIVGIRRLRMPRMEVHAP